MAATEADICNLALARVGNGQPVSDPLDATESASAALCVIQYPLSRDALLGRHPWWFATRSATLSEQLVASVASIIPGWEHIYTLPTDFLVGQYIFSGERPGQTAHVPFASEPRQLLQPGGAPPMVPFQAVGSYLHTDAGDPTTGDTWVIAHDYVTGDYVSFGAHRFRALQDHRSQQPPTAGANAYWSQDDYHVQLVYTAKVTTGIGGWPASFIDALAWRLAADLALSLATKLPLANALMQQAERAFLAAAASQERGRQPDPRPASKFITGRS